MLVGGVGVSVSKIGVNNGVCVGGARVIGSCGLSSVVQ